MVTIAVPTLRGMACLLVLVTPQACSLVGRERGRSIPFSEVAARLIDVRSMGHTRPDLLAYVEFFAF
jgi:hypothetical protein